MVQSTESKLTYRLSYTPVAEIDTILWTLISSIFRWSFLCVKYRSCIDAISLDAQPSIILSNAVARSDGNSVGPVDHFQQFATWVTEAKLSLIPSTRYEVIKHSLFLDRFHSLDYRSLGVWLDDLEDCEYITTSSQHRLRPDPVPYTNATYAESGFT